MSERGRSTTRIEIHIASHNVVKSLFHELSGAPFFGWNIVRGRVTRKSSRYELEVSSDAHIMEMLLGHLERPGVKVRVC